MSSKRTTVLAAVTAVGVLITVGIPFLLVSTHPFVPDAGETLPRTRPHSQANTETRGATEPDVERPQCQKAFRRPEELGEDFSPFEAARLLTILKVSDDKIERRKAAIVLGDRCAKGLLGDLKLEQRAAIDQAVDYLLAMVAQGGGASSEARSQIHRLWGLAVPALLKNLGHPDGRIAEAAWECLCLMRNEEIVRAAAEKARAAKTEEHKRRYAQFLGELMYQRTSVVNGRTCLGNAPSTELVIKYALPVLDHMSASDASEAVRQEAQRAVSRLIKMMENPPREATSPARM